MRRVDNSLTIEGLVGEICLALITFLTVHYIINICYFGITVCIDAARSDVYQEGSRDVESPAGRSNYIWNALQAVKV